MRSTEATLELIKALNENPERKELHETHEGFPITDYYKERGSSEPEYVTYDESEKVFILRGLRFESAEKVNEFWRTGDSETDCWEKTPHQAGVPENAEDKILSEVCRIANMAELMEHFITFEDNHIVVREATSGDDEVMRIEVNEFNEQSVLDFDVVIANKIGNKVVSTLDEHEIDNSENMNTRTRP